MPKNRTQEFARERFWGEHDTQSYQCPDCGRGRDELRDGFEMYHKDGNVYDNRIDNLIGLCRPCHNLRKGKKPSFEDIRRLRDAVHPEGAGTSSVPTSVLMFLLHRVADPPHTPWSNPFSLWWNEYEKFVKQSTKFLREEEPEPPGELLRGLTEQCGASLEMHDGKQLVVLGVALE